MTDISNVLRHLIGHYEDMARKDKESKRMVDQFLTDSAVRENMAVIRDIFKSDRAFHDTELDLRYIDQLGRRFVQAFIVYSKEGEILSANMKRLIQWLLQNGMMLERNDIDRIVKVCGTSNVVLQFLDTCINALKTNLPEILLLFETLRKCRDCDDIPFISLLFKLDLIEIIHVRRTRPSDADEVQALPCVLKDVSLEVLETVAFGIRVPKVEGKSC